MRLSQSLSVLTVAASILFSMSEMPAQEKKFVPNYDESKVPEYVLTDPLAGVKNAYDWEARRAKIFELIEREMFGKAPKYEGREIACEDDLEPFEILGGKARVSQPVLKIAGQNVRLLVVQPAKATSAVPAFLGYNFNGNHTVLKDARIALANVWSRSDGKALPATDDDRGKSASRWSVERIVDAGFALVTIYYGDVDPDFDDGFKNGIFSEFSPPKPGEWGSIAGWA